MKFENFELEAFVMFLEAEAEQSRVVLDEKIGFIFYPCMNAIEEGLEKSMA